MWTFGVMEGQHQVLRATERSEVSLSNAVLSFFTSVQDDNSRKSRGSTAILLLKKVKTIDFFQPLH